jgi:hypothetical protein
MSWEELGKTQIKIDPSQNDVKLTGSNIPLVDSESIVGSTRKRYAPFPPTINYTDFTKEFEKFLCLSKDKETLYGSQGANLRKSSDGWESKTTIWKFATDRPLVQELTITSATGGTFEIGLSAEDKTAALPHDVSAADLQTAIRGLTGVADSATVTLEGTTYTITHDMADADNALSVITNNLTGVGATIAIRTTQYYYLGSESNYVGAIKELDNGDLLVSTIGTTTAKSTLFHGHNTDGTWTFTPVLVSPVVGTQVIFDNHWSLSTHGCTALASFYGTWQVATKVYFSNDYGKVGTWTEVLDLLDPTLPITLTGSSNHIHAVAIDSYSGDFWVTYGDSSKGVLRSRDFGTTWESVLEGKQFTSVYPLKDYVVLGSDDGTCDQGVYRLNKQTLELEIGYKIAEAPITSGVRYCATSTYRGPDATSPLYIGFLLESGTGGLWVVGTIDGIDFYPIVKDSRIRAGVQSIDSFFGPTTSGKVFINDRSLGWTSATAPTWSEI